VERGASRDIDGAKIGAAAASVKPGLESTAPGRHPAARPMSPLVHRIALRHVLAGLCAASITGCGQDPDSSAVRELKAATRGEAAGIPEPEAGTPLPAILEQAAERFAGHMQPEGEPMAGELAEGERHDLMLVLKAGHCYRIFGAADAGVRDLDLYLYDGSGVQSHQDPAQSRVAMLGTEADICPAAASTFRLQVHMYKGGGRYRVQLYRSPG